MNSHEFVREIKEMAINMMHQDYTIKSGFFNSKSYNLHNLGWGFEMNQHTQASGQCAYSRHRHMVCDDNIHLSEWLMYRLEGDKEVWRQVMLHEIAHAIDVEIRGLSAHDDVWSKICRQIGNDGAHQVSVKFRDDVQLPFIVYCPTCGYETATPTLHEPVKHGESSCGVCDSTGYNSDYILDWKLADVE